MKVFISHGSKDAWIARQMARCVGDCGAETFVDVNDIMTGDDFKAQIRREIARSDELLALFTPSSIDRSCVWVEIGAAWAPGKRMVGIIYGMHRAQFEKGGGGRAVLADLHLRDLNEFDTYLAELGRRIANGG